MKLTSILLASALALSTASCRPAYLGPIAEYRMDKVSQIEDNSKLGQYYLSGDYKKKTLKKEIASELEEKIESSMSRYHKRKIDLKTPYRMDLGHTVVVAERGSLTSKYEDHILTKFDKDQQRAIIYLAERRNIKNMPVGFHKSKKFKNLVEALKESKPLEKSNKEFNVGKKAKYAATVVEIGGFAPYFMIFLDKEPQGLHRMVNLWAHEGAHTMFFVEGGMYESIFRNLPINETACDLIGNRTAEQFRKDYLIRGSKLERQFLESKAFNEKIENALKGVVMKYRSFSEKDRIEKRDEIMVGLENYFQEKVGFKTRVNEAKLIMWDRYSGNEKRYNRLDEMERIIGPNKFLKLVPKFRNDQELDKALRTFKKHGKKAFDSIMDALDKKHYVNLSDSVL